METRSNQILVGSITLGLLAALVLFVVWLSQAGAGGDPTATDGDILPCAGQEWPNIAKRPVLSPTLSFLHKPHAHSLR